MGLISAALSSANGVLTDSFKDYFTCDAIPAEVLAVKGKKKSSGFFGSGTDNIITNGSKIAVADGQCMIITDQGKVVDICAETGEYIYDISSQPSLFTGSLPASVAQVFREIGKRFTYGGSASTDQRVYYINIREITGNKYGTPNPVPFRVVDANVNLDIDVSVRCFGEYSYRIVNPILFYTNVCGNVSSAYTRSQIDSQLKSELLTALQPAFAEISAMGIRYSALPGHASELAEALNRQLSAKWRDTRGIEIVSAGVSSIAASEEDEKRIKELQLTAAFKDPTMAAAHLVNAQATAMQNAASNANGAAMGFYGLNAAGSAMSGIDIANLYAAAQAQNTSQTQNTAAQTNVQAQSAAQTGSASSSGTSAAAASWICASCGTENYGKFCTECGTKKPAGVPQYRCDKCGWVPADPVHPPKFCPECGDPFGDEDIVKE